MIFSYRDMVSVTLKDKNEAFELLDLAVEVRMSKSITIKVLASDDSTIFNTTVRTRPLFFLLLAIYTRTSDGTQGT